MHEAGLEELGKRTTAIAEGLVDQRLVDLSNVIDVLLSISRRTPSALREGMVPSLGTFLEAILEDRGAGGQPSLEVDEIVHLSGLLAADAAKFTTSAAGLSELLSKGLMDVRLSRDVATCIAALSCIVLHLSDSDQVHATALLDRTADVERAVRRALMVLSTIEAVDDRLRNELTALSPHLLSWTDFVVAALMQHDERVAWRCWRRAGDGAGRLDRARSIAKQMNASRSVSAVLDRIDSIKEMAL